MVVGCSGALVSQSTTFESFILGTVHYQGAGTTVNTGPPGNYTIPSPYGSLWTLADEWGFQKPAPVFDQEVKDDGSGNKVWRMSNAVTSGSFSFQPCTPSSGQPAGETTASLWNDRGPSHTGPFTGYPVARATASTPYFHAGFKFKSATGAAQTGLALSVSATPRQSSVRMSFVGITDNGSTGLNLTFAESIAGGSFSPTQTIASNLSYTDWHRVDIYIQFVDGLNGDGSGNDIVTVMLDGNVIHIGTTWETFYASPSWTSTPVPIAVDALMFRSGGTAVPSTAGNGYYFDNVVYDNEPLPVKVRVYSDLAETDYVNGYSTIQAAIANPTTLDGYVVRVDAGTYAENVVVNKSLTINGPNANIDPCTGTRVAEAIVTSAVSDITAAAIFYIAPNTPNVSIKGFTIDGDNTALTSGYLGTNGADIDAAEGVSTYETGINNLVVSNNIIQNLSYFGVTLYDYPAGVPSSGHVISNNKIQHLGTYDNASGIALWGGGVLLYNNQYTAVTNNCMTNVRLGVQTGNFYLANPGTSTSQVISGNTISARRRGIFHNLFYSSASPYTLSNNTITGIADANETAVWDGILLASMQSTASTASGNSINGAGLSIPSTGISIWNCQTPPLISGGNISNVHLGINVNNFEGYPTSGSNADNTSATIDGATITGATVAGIKVHDNPSNSNGADAYAEIKGNTNVSGSPIGIWVVGSDASANIHENSSSITANTTGLDVDGGTVSQLYRNSITGNATGVLVRNGGNLGLTSENFIMTNTVDGIRIEATAGIVSDITNNDLSANLGKAVNNLSTLPLNAICNWYGSNSGSAIAAKINGSVTYQPWLINGTDDGPVIAGFQPMAGACTGCPQPQLSATINGVTVIDNGDGSDDTGAIELCNNPSSTLTFNAFSDISGNGLSGVKVYQTVSKTNITNPFCTNCQALITAFPGASGPISLTDPTMPGMMTIRFRAWMDDNNDNLIDANECAGDWVQYTITVNPIPAISFTAQVAGRAAQNVNSATPQFGVLNFCAGESFSYSNYVSVPGNRVGVLEVLNGTGNVTYAGSPVAVPRAQIDFGVGGAPGYFNGSPYGPYGLSSGTFGQFIETFTPYYDSDNSGDYTPGDCVGNPISITYNVYALPNAIATPASQTICTNSSTNIALSSNVPGTTFSWVVQSTTGTVTGQTAGSGTNIAQTLTNSGGTNAFVTYRITPTGPAPNNCAGPTTDVIITVIPSLGITCQASFSVGTSSNGTGDCNGVANWTHPVQPIGSCSFVSLSMSINGGTPVPVTPGAAISQTFNVGTHTVAYVATDNASNTATCSFTITVVDDELPMVACKPHSITFNGQDSIALTVADLVLSSSDNCGIDTIVLQYNKLGCQSVGTTVPVVVTVTDINGNVNTCTANVTVGGLPCGWSSNSNSIGCNSNVVYTPGTGAWTNTASSCFYGPPFTVDDVSFAQRTLCGNGSITALVSSIDVFANAWAGITMRETNDVGAKKAQLMTNLSTLSRREFRTATNGAAQPQQFTSLNRYWLRIVRTGNQFAMYVSPNGTTWYIVGTQNIVMSSCIQIGLVTTNYTANGTSTCVFTNVSYTGGSTPLVQPGNVNPAQLANDVLEVEADFSVFPNPTSGALTLDLAQYIGRSVRIETYSLEGKLLQFSELDEVQNTLESLDLSRFQNGMYLVKVKSVGLPDVTRRVVKQ
ncbi:MAG TPA: HYR domain-containing protein [Saprospiraceae bacterium]|nr:HYR domain-containing protein [Saprospiraceae bacterium]